MRLAGLTTWIDAIGNVHGVLGSRDDAAPAIVVGSHYDTVRDGGKYDGALGIISAIAAAKALVLAHVAAHVALEDVIDLGSAGSQPGFVDALDLASRYVSSLGLSQKLHIVAFSDEEGLRFGSTFLGSRAFAGTLTLEHLAAVDAGGVSIADALQAEAGFVADAMGLKSLVHAGNISTYVEVHMEQGPVLQVLQQPVGVVSGIVAQKRLQVHVPGEQGHAGTVPMIGRKDALVTAARIVTRLSERCTQHQQQKLAPRRSRLTHWLCNSAVWSAAGDGWGLRNRLCGAGAAPPPSHAVCTIGSAGVWPGAPNVIPGAVTLTVDLRAADQELERLEAMLHSIVAHACRDAQCSTTTLHSARSVQSGLGTVAALQRAARSAAGGGDGAAPVMQSGAGHDAMAMADVAEVGMLFVRCRDGVSHSAEEFVAAGDMAVATRTLYAYLRESLF